MSATKQRDQRTGEFLPGNQVATKHGGHAFLITGKVPSVRGARVLKRVLTRIRKELEDMTPDLNVKKRLLIDQIVSATGFMKLFEMYVRKVGIPRPDQWKKRIFDVQPAFSFYLSLMNRQLQAVQALGVNKEKADEILAPYEIVEREKKAMTDEHN
jgi:hypothetical protein